MRRFTRVCQTIVVRPRCSGVASARTMPSRPAAKEIGLGLERRRRGPGRQVDERRGRPDRVGEGHDRAAVQRAATVRRSSRNRELGDEPIRRGLDEADAEELGEVGAVQRRQRGRVDRIHSVGDGRNRFAMAAIRRSAS